MSTKRKVPRKRKHEYRQECRQTKAGGNACRRSKHHVLHGPCGGTCPIAADLYGAELREHVDAHHEFVPPRLHGLQPRAEPLIATSLRLRKSHYDWAVANGGIAYNVDRLITEALASRKPVRLRTVRDETEEGIVT